MQEIPVITTEQMIEVDRLMIEEYGIQLTQMMENAGSNLAELGRRLLGADVHGLRIAVLSGAGNNGGGGMVAARHLHNWGADIIFKVIPGIEKLKHVPAHQFYILERMGVSNRETIDLDSVDLFIDALIGYGLAGDPRGPIVDWIQQINASSCPVLSLDSPSGLNTTTGIPGDPCIRAAATMTLALPKKGLMTTQAKPFVGDLYLADIGVPPSLYAHPSLGLEVGHIFMQDTIQRIDW